MGICRLALAVLAASGAMSAAAAAPADHQRSLELELRAGGAVFTGFSAQRGERFFRDTHGGEWSCASCHTANPLDSGRHAKTGKAILPLAPAANPARFTDAAKVDKWFRRNCNDVLGRACTSQEKGDILQYLMSLKEAR
jgi:hypothetical protein